MVSLLIIHGIQVKQVQRKKRVLKTEKMCIGTGKNVSRKRKKRESEPEKTCVPILVVIELLYNCLYSCYIVVIKRACARLGNSLRSFGLFQECVE